MKLITSLQMQHLSQQKTMTTTTMKPSTMAKATAKTVAPLAALHGDHDGPHLALQAEKEKEKDEAKERARKAKEKGNVATTSSPKSHTRTMHCSSILRGNMSYRLWHSWCMETSRTASFLIHLMMTNKPSTPTTLTGTSKTMIGLQTLSLLRDLPRRRPRDRPSLVRSSGLLRTRSLQTAHQPLPVCQLKTLPLPQAYSKLPQKDIFRCHCLVPELLSSTWNNTLARQSLHQGTTEEAP